MTTSGVSHSKVSGVADGGDSNLVRPSDWNDDHVISYVKPSGLTGATAASRYAGATTSGPPASGTFAVGDFVIDQTGRIYVCIGAGSPGTWIVAAGGGMAQTFIGYNAIGASWQTLTVDRAYFKQVTLATAGLVDSIDIYLRPSTDNIGGIHVMITNDNSGEPGVLVAGNASPTGGFYLSNSSSMPGAGRWVSIPLGAYLDAGTYWIGFMSDQARFDVAYDTGTDHYFTASQFIVTGAYPSAWAITTSSQKFSIRASLLTPNAGVSNRSYSLDTYTINSTYGDDFTGSALSGIWTRRNFTSGAETYQQGLNGSYLRIAMTGRAAGDGYFQTAPAGDWTFAMSFVPRYWTSNNQPWGIAVVNSVGTGVGTIFWNSPQAFIVAGITTYTTYSGSFQQTTADARFATSSMSQSKQWVYLRKSGTNYYGAFSFDGEIWSPETPAFSSSITVDRVGMLAHPIGGFVTGAYIDVDSFNKIA